MNVCRTLGEVVKREARHEDIVINKTGAVSDLEHHITLVLMHQVARDAGALCLPVEPYTECTAVDIVVCYNGVDCGVELNASHLVSPKLASLTYIVNMVVLNA